MITLLTFIMIAVYEWKSLWHFYLRYTLTNQLKKVNLDGAYL